MKKLLIALVYTALVSGANAGSPDIAALEALREGNMKKLVFQSEPKPVSDLPFQLQDDGGEGHLADYRGKYLLLNFWATWCAPCRKEMPQLDELNAEFGGDRFEVLTLATGRNSPAGIAKFFEENGIESLPRHLDPGMKLARDMAVLGLPVTVLIDPEGQEIARMLGDAEWNSASAKAIIGALVDDTGS
ncbi:Thiol-disulfide isomerase or thioredoxin [Cribrihabitans marinus]|uniref:Thiol-disulfide isomerase or thioredoxin n=1 Tax=Cribrihabitans marinus TaxID=1227549 RepID=A0A1H7CEZ6_9RHOB|nr:TlpA disulfide reductase family protein [Cribrihabitans marinus]GGH35313.1 thioredoxin [Cribrihabitans marinus]SEJ88279.1 Thiol-disulfide isomerase or thioredoxin [Cribrihabitans marinus]